MLNLVNNKYGFENVSINIEYKKYKYDYLECFNFTNI